MARIKDTSVGRGARRGGHGRPRVPVHVAARVGSRFTGRCPFHEERTPSFSVNRGDKLFYCFGCGKGGDVITFVREMEQLDFAEAVNGWPSGSGSRSSTRRCRRRSRRSDDGASGSTRLLEQATRFYERFLWESPPRSGPATTSRGGACARRSAASSASGCRPAVPGWHGRRCRRDSRVRAPGGRAREQARATTTSRAG